MIAALALIAALEAPTPAPPPAELVLTPLFQQGAALFLSEEVTAGGIGGGLGLQLAFRQRWLAQADLGALWLLGNPVLARLAFGVQHGEPWSPAVWVALGILWGQRVEFLTGDGRRPAAPSWAVGLRASPLRFTAPQGIISLLEPGVGTDLRGGLWLELTLVQAGVRW